MKTGAARKQAHVVTDLGFGDAGKGTMTDWLVRRDGAHAVIRSNGGGQAGHTVVTPDGRHHTFAQFGSGTFVPGTRTHLSQRMIVLPLAMVAEEARLRTVGVTDAFSRTTIDRNALTVTPFHRAANRLHEVARRDARHGTCGLGIGETVADSLLHPDLAIRVSDYLDPEALRLKLRRVQEHKREQMRDIMKDLKRATPSNERGFGQEESVWLEDAGIVDRIVSASEEFVFRAQIVDETFLPRLLAEPGSVIFEGAQGVLLDERRGFHPHTTWSRCTGENALDALAEVGYDGEVTRWGVVRAYATRHGQGPFVTEEPSLTKALPERHGEQGWAGAFRCGWFDSVATRYALAACGGIDRLAVTHVDRLRDEWAGEWALCERYWLPHSMPQALHRLFSESNADREVLDIAPGPFGDLDYQTRLTEAMRQVRGMYHRVMPKEGIETFVERLEAAIGHRASVLSYGPTANDKREAR